MRNFHFSSILLTSIKNSELAAIASPHKVLFEKQLFQIINRLFDVLRVFGSVLGHIIGAEQQFRFSRNLWDLMVSTNCGEN